MTFRKQLCDQKDGEISDLKEKLHNFKVKLSEARNVERQLQEEIQKLKGTVTFKVDKSGVVAARNRSACIVKESYTRRQPSITMCCRSNKTVMKNNEIPVQRDLGEWIDIDYRSN